MLFIYPYVDTLLNVETCVVKFNSFKQLNLVDLIFFEHFTYLKVQVKCPDTLLQTYHTSTYSKRSTLQLPLISLYTNFDSSEDYSILIPTKSWHALTGTRHKENPMNLPRLQNMVPV